MTKEMMINMVEGYECRIAIVNDGTLEELYIERASNLSIAGNIYKGRVTNVEKSIQAAFVDFGGAKNGFLHISDVQPKLFLKGKKSSEPVGRKQSREKRPPIQECLRKGMELIVQVTKEGIGTKGPTLTTYVSIPGRLLVMMPGMEKVGVSRKIEDEKERAKAKSALAEINRPDNVGFIVRTAAVGKPKRDLQRDLHYLNRLWKVIDKRINNTKAPAEIYRESDLVTRTLRDIYNTDIDRIICDSRNVANNVKEFLDVAMPRTKKIIELYDGKAGLFRDAGLEEEIDKAFERRVELPSGGSLVIDQTEALVAIDVNSGRSKSHSDAETTAMKTNIEAAKEIARQLRLRDLGGLVVIDFIDMKSNKNRREVEKTFRGAIKPDRAKTKLLRMSSFALLEMTRQRVRPSLYTSIYDQCPKCKGNGMVPSAETQSLEVLRSIQAACSDSKVSRIEVSTEVETTDYIHNNLRHKLSELEESTGKKITVYTDVNLTTGDVEITAKDQRGGAVDWSGKLSGGGKPKTVKFEESGSKKSGKSKSRRRSKRSRRRKKNKDKENKDNKDNKDN